MDPRTPPPAITPADQPPPPAIDPPPRRNWLLRSVAGLAGLVVVLVLVVLFFPWDVLRGPLNRIVSESTGRHFEITRKLDVKLGSTIRVLADGIEFANPTWARDPHLVKAEAAEIDVKFWPLLTGDVQLPLVSLTKPVIGLQMQEDGRRSWALGKDTSDTSTVPKIGAFVIDNGTINFVASQYGADITTQVVLEGETQADGTANRLPLSYKSKGTWNREAFSAEGRTGGVLQLSLGDGSQPFPLEVDARAGATTLKGAATIGQLATLDNTQATFDIRGRSLSDLYKLLGVVLPTTPRYALAGKLNKQGDVWQVSGMNGRLGQSDLAGDLSFDKSKKVPLLKGNLRSKSLDFDDLAPVIGGKADDAPAQTNKVVQRPGKVLPDTPLDFSQLKEMNAEVQYDIAQIRHIKELPLERAKVHINLQAGLLRLDPMELGVAGGTVTGSVRIDSANKPAVVATKLDARRLQLNKLFPAEALMKSGLGTVTGKVELEGRGNTTADVLASSSGNLALLTGRGQISNILLEFVGLDGGEIIKFLVGGDRNVRMRCAAAAFDVKDGLMTTRTFVLDTEDTVVQGDGRISLVTEGMDLTLRPQPKDRSILSLRAPIHIGGTFAKPSGSPDKGSLALRAGAAIALGAVNPLLALAATFEPGPGEDLNCVKVLAQAGTPLVRPRGAGRQVAEPADAAASAPVAAVPGASTPRVAGVQR